MLSAGIFFLQLNVVHKMNETKSFLTFSQKDRTTNTVMSQMCNSKCPKEIGPKFHCLLFTLDYVMFYVQFEMRSLCFYVIVLNDNNWTAQHCVVTSSPEFQRKIGSHYKLFHFSTHALNLIKHLSKRNFWEKTVYVTAALLVIHHKKSNKLSLKPFVTVFVSTF